MMPATSIAAYVTAGVLVLLALSELGATPPRRRNAYALVVVSVVFVFAGAIIQDASAKKKVRWHSAVASWYGPGLYGNKLACGGRLHPGTLGVAHKTMPCGTRVRFRYHGRKITVRVIDRGPYVAGRDFDLTAATKTALGFPNGYGRIHWRRP